MNTNPANNLSALILDAPLAVQIRADRDAPVLAAEPVSRADLSDAISEVWREGCLRAGYPAAALSQTPVRLAPTLSEESASGCTGYTLEVNPPGGQITRRQFSVLSLRHVAERAAAPFVQAKILKPGEPFFYELVVASKPAAAEPARANQVSLHVSLRSAPLKYLNFAIRTLLEKATPVAILDEAEPPVFFTREAFAKAEACARRGGDCVPPVETGGVFLGSLVACPDSGEFAAIISDVIEVQDAEQKTFSLSYSSQTWMRIQAIQQARQAAYPRRAERILGQGHGHSFLPNDGKTCAECQSRPVCNLTSVFVSLDDQTWHRAVFARQPWALCHIFGLTARGDRVNQLYGLKDGRLQARGYYLIPEFSLPE